MGENDVWVSYNPQGPLKGTWSTPVNLRSPFNSAIDDDQMWTSPVTNDRYWNSAAGLMHCVYNGTTCAAPPTAVVIPGCSYAAEASLPDDGKTIYFACGDLKTYEVKIMYSVKKSDVKWGTAIPVD